MNSAHKLSNEDISNKSRTVIKTQTILPRNQETEKAFPTPPSAPNMNIFLLDAPLQGK